MNDIEWLNSLGMHWLSTQTPPKVGRPPQRIEPKKLTQIYRLMSRGLTLQAVAKKVMISRSTLHKVLSDSKHPDSVQLNEAVRRGKLNARAPIGAYLTELRFQWIEVRLKLNDSEQKTVNADGTILHDPNDPLLEEAASLVDLIELGIKFAEGLEQRGIDKLK
jgi:transcriptional regulator with XRE-family HTH domain